MPRTLVKCPWYSPGWFLYSASWSFHHLEFSLPLLSSSLCSCHYSVIPSGLVLTSNCTLLDPGIQHLFCNPLTLSLSLSPSPLMSSLPYLPILDPILIHHHKLLDSARTSLVCHHELPLHAPFSICLRTLTPVKLIALAFSTVVPICSTIVWEKTHPCLLASPYISLVYSFMLS